MRLETKALRDAVKHIPGAWVRVFHGKDKPHAWAGCRGDFVKWSVGGEKMMAVKRALEAAGYTCRLNGQPGTSGEYIIDVDL